MEAGVMVAKAEKIDNINKIKIILVNFLNLGKLGIYISNFLS